MTLCVRWPTSASFGRRKVPTLLDLAFIFLVCVVNSLLVCSFTVHGSLVFMNMYVCTSPPPPTINSFSINIHDGMHDTFFDLISTSVNLCTSNCLFEFYVCVFFYVVYVHVHSGCCAPQMLFVPVSLLMRLSQCLCNEALTSNSNMSLKPASYG